MTSSSIFPLLGEPLALDLVNTRIHRGGTPVDLLEQPTAFRSWLRCERGHVAWRGPVRTRDLTAVRALRDAMDRLLRAHIDHARGPVADIRKLNRALATPTPTARLAWPPSGPRKASPATSADAQLAGFLRQLARSTLDLLTGPDAARLRQCAHPACILLFVAHHPRRRWCSSAICGNRARVARHYAQQHKPD